MNTDVAGQDQSAQVVGGTTTQTRADACQLAEATATSVDISPTLAFELLEFSVEVKKRLSKSNNGPIPETIEAKVKVQIEGEHFHIVSEGNGPVNALDNALRKALEQKFPQVKDVHLSDYNVSIMNPEQATAAITRVSIEARSGDELKTTVGVSTNIFEASISALAENYDYFLRER